MFSWWDGYFAFLWSVACLLSVIVCLLFLLVSMVGYDPDPDLCVQGLRILRPLEPWIYHRLKRVSFIPHCKYTAILDLDTFPEIFRSAIIGNYDYEKGLLLLFLDIFYSVDSRNPRNSLKYFEISIPRNIRFAELRNKMSQTTTYLKWICNLTPEVRDI